LANVARIRQRPVTVAGFRRESLTGFRPDLGCFGQILPVPTGIWSAGGRIPTTGCCLTPGPTGFRRSDIKRACKDEEFNFGKRFTVLKIVNRFPKIKKAFTVKPKMIFVDHYFRPYQTL